jgi:hypothetical protein
LGSLFGNRPSVSQGLLFWKSVKPGGGGWPQGRHLPKDLPQGCPAFATEPGFETE